MRFVLVLSVLSVATIGQAGEAGQEFYRLSPTEYSALFAAGDGTRGPVGAYRARVVWFEEARSPRVRGRLQSVIFRGKTFADDGSFTNRFLGGINALPSHGRCEASWVDGNPAYVLDYPSKYPLFGSYRDELRLIGSDVWLGRVWNRTTGQTVAWFVLSK